MLKARFIRDREHRIRGTVVSGYTDGHEVVRNKHGQIIGHALPKPGISKDQNNQIISLNADSGFFFGFGGGSDE